MPIKLVVSEGGQRLDRFLVHQLPDRTRSQLQKLIKVGTVLLNGRATSAHRLLKVGDRIVIKEVAVQPLASASVPSPTVIFENEQVLVISKPAGLVVHPGAGVRGKTLINWLVQHVPAIVSVGDSPTVRPGIVHRLDRDVSGVMVIAKTQASFEHLKQQFKNRSVKKEYLALVHGVPKQRSGTINFRIERSNRQPGRMAARPAEGKGRTATTHYAVEQTIQNNALLRIQIETGRTHQIRVHLKALGHPIVGDSVYTTKSARRKPTTLSRPWLHAARLKFQDLDGTTREFEAPLPKELEHFLWSPPG